MFVTIWLFGKIVKNCFVPLFKICCCMSMVTIYEPSPWYKGIEKQFIKLRIESNQN